MEPSTVATEELDVDRQGSARGQIGLGLGLGLGLGSGRRGGDQGTASMLLGQEAAGQEIVGQARGGVTMCLVAGGLHAARWLPCDG